MAVPVLSAAAVHLAVTIVILSPVLATGSGSGALSPRVTSFGDVETRLNAQCASAAGLVSKKLSSCLLHDSCAVIATGKYSIGFGPPL